MAKVALLIGVSEYELGLNPLPAAVKDVEAMGRVLANPEMGGFAASDITVLKNPQRQEMEDAIYRLFSNRQRDDLLLFYFSGHGVKDESGKLYLSTRTTRKENGRLVKPSAVAASFLHESINESKSQRQILILDCCFSGAIAQGMTVKDDGTVNLQEQLGGKGRAILTATTSTQYSFEQEGSELSIYTRYLVEGIEKGAADQDGDGYISVDELHEYASGKVKEAFPAMTPKFFPVEEGHKILLAKSPKDDPNLKYRKEVENRSIRGQISVVGRRFLDDLRDSLGLTPENATAIEDEVLKPYREYQKKLQRYEQAFAEAVQQENGISDAIRDELKHYQEFLGLRDQDIAPVETRYVPRREIAQPQPQPPKTSQSNLDQGDLTNVTPHSKSTGLPVARIGCLSLLLLVLSAIITVPFFLNQATKAKQAEAKQYVSAMNKGQQAFYTEKGKFSSNLAELGIGIATETTYYTYKTQAVGAGEKAYAINTATPKQDGLKSYTGGVMLNAKVDSTISLICQSPEPSKTPPAPPKLVGGTPKCATGSVELD
ncbi:MAG TPA: Clp protease [Cyanobacteria bacterium UBA11372]|nr:Clp protease [Cyanobacteria bacterium UBA11372]